MSDPTDRPWHCRQIPNGNEPLVVCEREELLDSIAELTEERDRYRDHLRTLAAMGCAMPMVSRPCPCGSCSAHRTLRGEGS